MKVAVLSDVKEISIEERPIPDVQRGEALIKVEGCGICGSDVRAYESGLLFPLGLVMGHECAGTVVEVGPEVQDYTSGDRVVVLCFWPCGSCVACRRGLTQYCHNAPTRTIGECRELDGAYAEHLWIPDADQMLVQIDDNVSFEEAILTEPLWVSLHTIRTSRFRPGDTVAVLGAGTIGLLAIQLLRIGGAGVIVCTELSQVRSEIARKVGADVVLNPEDEGDQLKDKVIELSGGMGVDVVFECSGTSAAFHQAFDIVRPGGQIMQVGIIERDPPIPLKDLVFRQIDLQGSLAYSRHEFEMALDFITRKQINTELFISDTIPLEEIEERGFKRLLSSSDVIKIIVKP